MYVLKKKRYDLIFALEKRSTVIKNKFPYIKFFSKAYNLKQSQSFGFGELHSDITFLGFFFPESFYVTTIYFI